MPVRFTVHRTTSMTYVHFVSDGLEQFVEVILSTLIRYVMFV